MPISTKDFRDVAGLFATGVTIVATEVGGHVHAMTANSVTSVSLDPMLMLFCPNRKARIAQDVNGLTHFTINVLREDQQALSSYFAGGWRQTEPPPFRFITSPAGPCLEGALAIIGCETHQVIEAGDHWMVLGRVIDVQKGGSPQVPLLFMSGQYRSMDRRLVQRAPDIAAVADEPPNLPPPEA